MKKFFAILVAGVLVLLPAAAQTSDPLPDPALAPARAPQAPATTPTPGSTSVSAFGFSPGVPVAILILAGEAALMGQSTDEDDDDWDDDDDDTTAQGFFPTLLGTISLSGGQNHWEDVGALTWYPYLFDVSWQRRWYTGRDLDGLFVGSFLSAESFLANFSYDHGSWTIDSQGPVATWGWGVRAGVSGGFRFWLGDVAITPQLGYVLPMETFRIPGRLTAGQREEVWSSLFQYRSLEFNLMFQFRLRTSPSAPAAAP